MSAPTQLERRYRRLLALYPKPFRHEHEEEMIAVLLDSAAPGQRRPRLEVVANLVRTALFMRLRTTKIPTAWEYRHARVVVPVRVISGLWLVVLTIILYGHGHGGWWGALLIPAAALHFFLAYRLRDAVRR